MVSRRQCAQFVTKYLPDNLEIGPFCPDTIYEEGGIWEWDGVSRGLYRLNEAFFTMLKEQGFDFYDADGNVYIGDPAGALFRLASTTVLKPRLLKRWK